MAGRAGTPSGPNAQPATHVVCIGDLMLDIVAGPTGPLAPGSSVVAPVSVHGGGAGANVAAWIVDLGGRSTFVGRIGDDPMGLQAIDQLTAAGVEPLVDIDTSHPTGLCIVLVDETGERSFISSVGANAAGCDASLLPAEADVLYVSGYALLSASARPSTLEAMAEAWSRGWAVAVDAASDTDLIAAGPDLFLDWISPAADPPAGPLVLFANVDEAAALTGSTDAEKAARALGGRCGQSVVMAGADGALWSDGETVSRAVAPTVAVTDTTGAGDAFVAGFLVARGEPEDRLAAGVRLASCVVTRVGARPDPR